MALKEEDLKQVKHRKPRKLPKVLTQRQVGALFATINIKCPTGLRNRVMLECAYRAGLRISEICNIAPEDIIWEKKQIFVQQGKNRKDRLVYFGPELLKWLKKWDEIRPQSKYFFCSIRKPQYGEPVSPVYMRQVLKRLSERSGVYLNDNHTIKAVTPHVLRHSYATNLLENKINIRKVQQQLGHADVSTTMLYTHVVDDSLAAEIEALG